MNDIDVIIKDEGDFHIIKLITEKAKKTAIGSGLDGNDFGVRSKDADAIRKWVELQNLTVQEF